MAQVEVRSIDGDRSYQLGYGGEARWCRACDELFFRAGNEVYAVEFQLTDDFEWKPAERAFEIEGFIDTGGWSYDVSPDGQRLIVVVRDRELPRDTIRVITDWTSGLETPASQ